MKNACKRLSFTLLMLLILSILLVACGGGDEEAPTAEAAAATAEPDTPAEPTATEPPPATDTPAPTDTPVPTDTPAPTATPDITAGFTELVSAEGGVTVSHPAAWLSEEIFGFITMATSEDLLDDPEPGDEGGLFIIIPGSIEEIESDDPITIINQTIAEFDLGENIEYVQDPTTTTINGQDAATAIIHGEDEVALTAYIVAIVSGERGAIGVGATPQETEAEFLPTLEAIASTIILSEPVEPGVVVPDSEGLLLYGETVNSAVTAAGSSSWTFLGLAGETVNIIVEPDETLDVMVSLLDDSGIALVNELDESFGTEEVRDFTLPADGEYTILLTGFADSTGAYTLSLQEAGAAVGSEGTILYDEIVSGSLDSGDQVATWGFVASAGDIFSVKADSIDTEFDLILDVVDSNGNSIVNGPIDFFTDTEYAKAIEIEESGTYSIVISSFEGTTGAYEIDFDLLLGATEPGTIFYVSETLEAGDEHAYPFNSLNGDTVTAIVQSEPDLDTVLQVYDDDVEPAELLVENDFGIRLEELSFTANKTGNYFYQVVGFEGSVGNYEIALVGPIDTIFELAFGDEVIGRLGEGDHIDYWFGGDAGDTVEISLVSDEGFDAVIELYDLDDNLLASVDDALSGDAETLSYTFSEDQLIVIRVLEFFENAGEFRLFLE